MPNENLAYVPGAALFGYERLATYSASPVTVDWTDPDLARVVRLKILTDPGYPYLDVSYCYGELTDGTPVRVRLPFHNLPKRGARRAIVEHAKRAGVFAQRLGLLDALAWD